MEQKAKEQINETNFKVMIQVIFITLTRKNGTWSRNSFSKVKKEQLMLQWTHKKYTSETP